MEFYRVYVIVALIRRKEPGLFHMRDRSANRAANVIGIEIRVRILALERGRSKNGLTVEIVKSPRGERRVLVVVNGGTVVFGTAAFRRNTNVCNPSVFRAK